jgi:hypothetical protein
LSKSVVATNRCDARSIPESLPLLANRSPSWHHLSTFMSSCSSCSLNLPLQFSDRSQRWRSSKKIQQTLQLASQQDTCLSIGQSCQRFQTITRLWSASYATRPRGQTIWACCAKVAQVTTISRVSAASISTRRRSWRCRSWGHWALSATVLSNQLTFTHPGRGREYCQGQGARWSALPVGVVWLHCARFPNGRLAASKPARLLCTARPHQGAGRSAGCGGSRRGRSRRRRRWL